MQIYTLPFTVTNRPCSFFANNYQQANTKDKWLNAVIWVPLLQGNDFCTTYGWWKSSLVSKSVSFGMEGLGLTSIITNYLHIYKQASCQSMFSLPPLFLFWPAALCRPPSLSSPSFPLYMHSYAGGCKNSLFGGVGWGCWSMVTVGISSEEALALCWL